MDSQNNWRVVFKREGLKLELKHYVTLCHGGFDLIHVGHTDHLRSASQLGHPLLVSITDDGFLKKGRGRPFMPANDRASVLAALEVVDAVIINESYDASNILKEFLPRYYVKGGDYRSNDRSFGFTQELQVAKQYGIELVFVEGERTRSTTEILSNYIHRYGANDGIR